MLNRTNTINFLQQLFHYTIQEASPINKMNAWLPAQKPHGRVIVVGAGKAAAAMAAEWERIWPQDYPPLSGVVVTRYGHSVPTKQIQVLEASHPLPDSAGQAAAQALLNAVSGLNADDQVYYLVSGGASALTTLPVAGITLADKQNINRQLLSHGVPIEAMNTLRKHLSRIKGGRLAEAAAPAHITTLAISDVVGDDISTIGSGAAVADPTTLVDIESIVNQYQLNLPASVAAYLHTAAAETPKKLPNSSAHIIITPHQAFSAAQNWAQNQNIDVLYLGDRIGGEAREVAQVMAGIALFQRHQRQTGKPLLILSGGETTVTLNQQQGRGGRNSEFLLALAIALNGADNIYALAADTDGIDGSEDNAGAWLTPDSLLKAQQNGLCAATMLQQHRAYDFFATTEQLLLTTPTRTNINDFRAILVL
ncbi:glycerate kinase type-2 family protein [Snodgrassella communis]|uniref:glycerate kinase type-2 family protein n=1 Tax=Snodgrassella communis TaxID=2946699 RepID=UPI00286A9206|nr:glycerate kinase [Snodgrassella communis]WMY91411.1 glycerate kinase [Snodgrassella communis]